MTPETDPFDFDLASDFQITRRSRQAAGAGTWVQGTLAGHRFDALVFPEHATNPDWELAGSRISKLSVQRSANRKTVFSWDRGPDIDADNDLALAIVHFLCDTLANRVYASKP